MRTMRTFKISTEKAGLFKEYCRDMHIPTEIIPEDGFKTFYCLMDEVEFGNAKQFCEARCKPEPEKRKSRISVYIIIEETR